MTQTITVSTKLAAEPDRVWAAVNRPKLLTYVAAPLIRFRPTEPDAWPDRWDEGEYTARMRLYGLVPIGLQVIGISRPAPVGHARFLRDDGRGSGIRRWDHLITIKPDGSGTFYEDRIEIDAGGRTPFVAAFANRFYHHRQARWRQLVAADFAPIEAA